MFIPSLVLCARLPLIPMSQNLGISKHWPKTMMVKDWTKPQCQILKSDVGWSAKLSIISNRK